MTLVTPLQFSSRAFLFIGAFLANSLFTSAQEQPPAAKTAAQQFKNVQILKDIPADQLIPTMQFIS